VIRILLGPRFLRSTRKLTEDDRLKVEAALCGVAEHFGNPHRHGGLGLRKLAGGLWECRAGLKWRIVLIQDPDRLRAYDLMDHDQLRAWLKGRKH